jgi:hypothetical protein
MTHAEFCYWLQGHFELNGRKALTEEQVDVIIEHLNLTFNKVTTKTVPEPSKWITPKKSPYELDAYPKVTCSMTASDIGPC